MDGYSWCTVQECRPISSSPAAAAGHLRFRSRVILAQGLTAVVVQAAHFTAAVRVVRGEEANSVFDNGSDGFPGASG